MHFPHPDVLKNGLIWLQMRLSIRWASQRARKRMWAAAVWQRSWPATPLPRRRTTVSALGQHDAAHMMLSAMFELVLETCPAVASHSIAALVSTATHGADCSSGAHDGIHGRALVLELQCCAPAPDLQNFSVLMRPQTLTPRSCRSILSAVLQHPYPPCFPADSDGEELPYTEEFFLPGSGASRGLTSQDLEASRTQTWDDPVATVSIDDVDKPGALPGQMKTPSP